MDYPDIVRQDPYLAGHIAARSYEWWDPLAWGPEETAVSCGLDPTEEAFARFLRGWKDCLDEIEIDRLKAQWEEWLKEGEKGCTHGDPTVC